MRGVVSLAVLAQAMLGLIRRGKEASDYRRTRSEAMGIIDYDSSVVGEEADKNCRYKASLNAFSGVG